MWKKTLLAGTAAVVLAGSSIVYAQQQGTGGAGGPSGSDERAAGHGHFSPEDRAAFLDARIAALKAGLQLTPDQEKSWPAFETALRNLAKLRAERMQERFQREGADQQPANPIERLKRRADMLSNTGAALKQLATAEEPLLASLTDAQKHRFFMLARMARARMAFMRHEGHEGGREEDRGGMMGRMGERMQHWQHPVLGRHWRSEGSSDETNGDALPDEDAE